TDDCLRKVPKLGAERQLTGRADCAVARHDLFRERRSRTREAGDEDRLRDIVSPLGCGKQRSVGGEKSGKPLRLPLNIIAIISSPGTFEEELLPGGPVAPCLGMAAQAIAEPPTLQKGSAGQVRPALQQGKRIWRLAHSF